jgi:DNA invertase Pin-like site-specific DNA recombinase
MSYINTFATWEQYLLYLRKSRQDDPNETVEQVLAKHEIQLQEFAVREFGAKIPESNIYREVVSGESIQDREEVKKLLARIEDPNIKGVIVIEPSRLSRGDLLDCGRLINDLRYTKTLVVTPYMTYDLENKMERKFFQDELLRGSDYLEYTKEILWRGRVAAAKRGTYQGQYAPFGYKKIKVGKDNTLEIIPEEAEIVRFIFDQYVNGGLTPGAIAKKLNEMGVPACRGEKWPKDTVRNILRNEHYTGRIVFNKIKQTVLVENGQKITKRITQDAEDWIVVPGMHEAIIDDETWEAAKKLVARNPRQKHTYALKNPLASILVCGKCGGAMYQHPYKHAEDRYECRTLPRCYKSVKMSEIFEAVITVLEEGELPELKLKLKNGDGDALKIQQKLLAKLEKQLREFEEQEDKQFELLETGMYSQDVFERRHTALRGKMDACREEIFKTKQSMPKSVDYAERVKALEDAIEMFKDPDATPEEKNKLLRAVVERIEFTGIASDHLNRVRNKHNYSEFTLKAFLRL